MFCFIQASSFCMVAKYQNKKETEKVGRQIRKLRIDNNFLEDDIAFMTGFA